MRWKRETTRASASLIPIARYNIIGHDGYAFPDDPCLSVDSRNSCIKETTEQLRAVHVQFRVQLCLLGVDECGKVDHLYRAHVPQSPV
jgi:hypothetical protein